MDNTYYQTATIQSLDPLAFDAYVPQIQQANSQQDTAFLVQTLNAQCAQLEHAQITSKFTALAAMRDLGILLGSVKRHGIEPLTVAPEIEPWLMRLGALTDLIPRDTVLHYTAWNPDGERRRAYTADPQERKLQAAVVYVYPKLCASILISTELQMLDPCDARFSPLIACLNELTLSMVKAIDSVIQEVSPIFFAKILRPYYEDIQVGSKRYLGPAAAQVPLWLVDLCTWASDRCSANYQTFLDESIPYCLPRWRQHYQQHMGCHSLVSKLEATLLVKPYDLNFIRSAQSVANLLRTLKTFRGRHFGIARQAYAPDVRLYDHGSGGAPLELLKEIIELTKENERLAAKPIRNATIAAQDQ